jgi:predicted O-methyltransferase YrrM
MNTGILNPAVEEYLYSLLPPRDAVLASMERLAEREDIPIVGPAVGRLLALLVQLTGAKRIFELGSAIGYSTIWLARAAGARAEVFFTDNDPRNARRADLFFRRAKVRSRIRIRVGDALAVLDATPGTFDLIFNDVDKQQYPEVFRRAFPRLRKGGLLVADNALWHGHVVRRAADSATRAVQQFNEMIFSLKQTSSVIIPLRDGVAICRKD